MATSYPTALDTLTNPLSTDTLDSDTVPHHAQHANANDAIEALQAKIGITNSPDVNSLEYKVNNIGVLSATTAVMTSTQANSTTTVDNVTQLVLPMEANGVYQVNAFVTFQSAATTTGLGLYYTSPTGCRCMCEMVVPITSTAVASQLRVIYPNAATAINTGLVIGTGVTAINSNHTAMIRGIIRNGATAGNLQIQFRSEVAGSAITLQIGSELQLIRIA